MHLAEIAKRGLVLVGCGNMGGALLDGWIERGVDPSSVHVVVPRVSPEIAARGVRVDGALPDAPAFVVLAVKPQIMRDAVAPLAELRGGKTVFLSVAAGVTLDSFREMLDAKTPVIRAMPNTPSAIGRGITALIGNDLVDDGALCRAEELLRAVGATVRLDQEEQMDAVTAVSGSGPAYVFHLIEALAAAARAQGLAADLALKLARATVAGAGALAEASRKTPTDLRIDVTSPNGTTQAALKVLMDEKTGLTPLINKTVEAAAAKSRELKNG